jgi:hypothetical protein
METKNFSLFNAKTAKKETKQIVDGLTHLYYKKAIKAIKKSIRYGHFSVYVRFSNRSAIEKVASMLSKQGYKAFRVDNSLGVEW